MAVARQTPAAHNGSPSRGGHRTMRVMAVEGWPEGLLAAMALVAAAGACKPTGQPATLLRWKETIVSIMTSML